MPAEAVIKGLLQLGIDPKSLQQFKKDTRTAEEQFHDLQEQVITARKDISRAVLAGADPTAAEQRLSQLKAERNEILDVAKAQSQLVKARQKMIELERARKVGKRIGAEVVDIEHQIREQAKLASEAQKKLAAAQAEAIEKAIPAQLGRGIIALPGKVKKLTDTLAKLGFELDGTPKKFLDLASTVAGFSADPLNTAVKLIAQAQQEYANFTAEVEKSHKQTADKWISFSEERIKTDKSALDAAKAYNAAQDGIQKALDDGGIVADIFIDKRAVLNAKEREAHRLLAVTATDFEDFTAGIDYLNENLEEGENALREVTEAEYARIRATYVLVQAADELATAVNESRLSLEDIAESEGPEQLGKVVHQLSQLQKMKMKPEQALKALVDATDSTVALAAAVRAYNEELEAGEHAIHLVSVEHLNQIVVANEIGKEITSVLGRWGHAMKEQTLTTDQAITAVERLITKHEALGHSTTELEVQLSKLIRAREDEAEAAVISLAGLLDAYEKEVAKAQESFTREVGKIEKEQGDREIELEEELGAALLKVKSKWDAAQTEVALDEAQARGDILDQLGIDMVNTETGIAQQRQDAMIDFAKESRAAEEEYYKQRLEAAEDFGIEMRRAEEDHQKEMRRMREDSEGRQRDAIRSRDALALRDEKRSYEKERSRAEEDYALGITRQNEDFARQMVQQEAAFREQQAARQRNYEEQLVTLAAQQIKEQATLQAAADDQLDIIEGQRVNALRTAHDQMVEEEQAAKDSAENQLDALKESNADQVTQLQKGLEKQEEEAAAGLEKRRQDLGYWTAEEQAIYLQHYNDLLIRTRDWALLNTLEYQKGLPTLGGMQAGGYAGPGVYRLGEGGGREFVMSNPTVKAAERFLGGPLTQGKIMAAMATNQNSSSMTFNIHEAHDPMRVAQMVRQQVLVELNKVFGDIR